MITIYKITNLVNGKMYVGQTSRDMIARFNQHKGKTSKTCLKLINAFNKHGRENFVVMKLADASTQLEADVLEVHFIAKLDTVNSGYNLRSGGSRGTNSPETRQRMSAAKRGNTNRVGTIDPPEVRAKKSEALKGNTRGLGYNHTPEAIEKIRAFQTGRPKARRVA